MGAVEEIICKCMVTDSGQFLVIVSVAENSFCGMFGLVKSPSPPGSLDLPLLPLQPPLDNVYIWRIFELPTTFYCTHYIPHGTCNCAYTKLMKMLVRPKVVRPWPGWHAWTEVLPSMITSSTYTLSIYTVTGHLG